MAVKVVRRPRGQCSLLIAAGCLAASQRSGDGGQSSGWFPTAPSPVCAPPARSASAAAACAAIRRNRRRLLRPLIRRSKGRRRLGTHPQWSAALWHIRPRCTPVDLTDRASPSISACACSSESPRPDMPSIALSAAVVRAAGVSAAVRPHATWHMRRPGIRSRTAPAACTPPPVAGSAAEPASSTNSFRYRQVLGAYQRGAPEIVPDADANRSAYVRIADRSRRRHDGFYFRFAGGLGRGHDSMKSDRPLPTNVELFFSPEPLDGSGSGLAAVTEVAVGFTPWRGVVLGVGSYTATISGLVADVKDPNTGPYLRSGYRSSAVLGPLVDWYVDPRIAGSTCRRAPGVATYVAGVGEPAGRRALRRRRTSRSGSGSCSASATSGGSATSGVWAFLADSRTAPCKAATTAASTGATACTRRRFCSRQRITESSAFRSSERKEQPGLMARAVGAEVIRVAPVVHFSMLLAPEFFAVRCCSRLHAARARGFDLAASQLLRC